MQTPPPLSPPGPDQEQEAPAITAEDAVLCVDAPGTAAPLLDLRILQDMERDFSDVAVVRQFADDFCATVEDKLDRFATTAECGNLLGAQDAVLSLTASAAMVGAPRLTRAAQAAGRQLAANDLQAAMRSLALLRACSAETRRELRRIYLTRR